MDNEMPIVCGRHTCNDDGAMLEVTVTSQGHSLDEVVRAFECALRGCGYVFDGHFELEED